MDARRTVRGKAPVRALTLLVLGPAAVAALLTAPAAEAASIITVTTLADPGAGGCETSGECSLREALERVSSGAVGGEVEVVVEPEGEIQLAGNELEVQSPAGLESLAIVGPRPALDRRRPEALRPDARRR